MNLEPGKIPDPELRCFAEGGGPDEPRSVLVELVMDPAPIVPRGRVPRPRMQPSERPTPGGLLDIEGHADSMLRLETELRSLGLGDELVRLSVAQAFAVCATPAQLRALSRLPLVGVIRPNRTHRTPSGR
jgi:hypothetical protein